MLNNFKQVQKLVSPCQLPHDSESLDILIVESDRKFLRKLGSMIEMALKSQQERSFSLTSTQNLHNASRLLSKQNFDIILTDINLSDASGFVVIEELTKYGDHTPIVVLSNITDWSMILETAQIGISDFLLKNTIDAGILLRSVFYSIERRKMELKAKWSEQNHQVLVENLPAGVIRSDAGMSVTYVNSVFANMMDRTAESIKGNTVMEVLGIDHKDAQLRQMFDKVSHTHMAEEFELVIQKNLDEQISALCIATPFFDQLGNLAGLQYVIFNAVFKKHSQVHEQKTFS